MKASLKWIDKVQFETTSGSGHKVMLDGPEAVGGVNAGARPMELILMGLLGCSSYDVVEVLRKARQKVVSCEAFVDAERADEIPAVFTDIHLKFVVTGTALKKSLVERAVALSAEKYCSASIMMQKAGVKISHSFEVLEVDE